MSRTNKQDLEKIMRYLICKTQVADGCDYSIGCGMVYKFAEFDGQIGEAAKHFAKEIAYPEGEGDDGYFALEGERDLKEVWVIPADHAIKINLELIRMAQEEKEQKRATQEENKRELVEFKRLKAKFEGSRSD